MSGERVSLDDAAVIDFRIRPAASAGESSREIADDVAPYHRVYGGGIADAIGVEDLLVEMAEHQIVGVVQAEYEEGSAQEANMKVVRMLSSHPDRFVGGIASADPREADALSDLQWAHDELGLKGWVFQPGFLQVRPTDPRCYPLYAYCEREGHPVTIHTGINFSRSGPIEYGRPLWIDEVACRYPGLTIICNHGGWPWVLEMIAVLWKHDHVFADFGGVAPKYMVGHDGGWAPIVHWMNRQLSTKVLFGSDWPMLRYGRFLQELPLLGLSEASERRYVTQNATDLITRVWG